MTEDASELLESPGSAVLDEARIGPESLLAASRDVGIGVDMEPIVRFADPDPRLFTAQEWALCESHGYPAECRAGRWCAKEAVAKACSVFLLLSLREVEILSDERGRPVVKLSQRATERGLSAEASISHASGLAVAVAVARCVPPVHGESQPPTP